HAKTTPAAKSPSPASSPTTASPLQALKPGSIKPYGPYGAQGDDPQAAYEAIDGSTATRWRSDWYSTASFGNTQSGTGLMIDLGHPVTIDSATITIGTPGASIQLRGGDTPAEAAAQIIGGDLSAPATAVIRPEETPIRYLPIWFPPIPPPTAGPHPAALQAPPAPPCSANYAGRSAELERHVGVGVQRVGQGDPVVAVRDVPLRD